MSSPVEGNEKHHDHSAYLRNGCAIPTRKGVTKVLGCPRPGCFPRIAIRPFPERPAHLLPRYDIRESSTISSTGFEPARCERTT